jgi:hypothetical protein
VAVIHRAYTFDPLAFHQDLQAKLVVDNQLRLEILRDLAISISAHPTETIQQVLIYLEFDSEWFDTDEEDVSYTDKWYVLALAEKLSPAPSLSHRCQVSFRVLEDVLPFLGWSPDEIKLLVYGERLHRILELFGHPLFVAEFRCINSYGGWLSTEIAAQLLSHLLLMEDFFPSAALEVRKDIKDLAGWWSRSPADLLSQAYTDAREMLETALARKQALYLLLDS